MAKKKKARKKSAARKAPKRRTARKAPAARRAAPRKRRNKATHHAAPRRSSARRPFRRRRNAGGGSVSSKKLAMLTGVAIVGGLIGLFASQQVDARVAQPPRMLGLGKMALAGAGLYAGIKAGQPAIGVGLAAALGASGGMNLLASFQAPPAAAAPPAMPPADAPPQMAAVIDAPDDEGMAGYEGMAAVQDATGYDEAGRPMYADDYEDVNADPYSGSDAEA